MASLRPTPPTIENPLRWRHKLDWIRCVLRVRRGWLITSSAIVRSPSGKPGRPECSIKCYLRRQTRKGECIKGWAGARFLCLGGGLIARKFNEAPPNRMKALPPHQPHPLV
ncbi:hypothetical protein FIBSPDRAFT_104896 [Athelia psychrophila]|uniref:Uncharacterized protein n=1 Tax=Athelia psychrophila TaxID=1759441 RepID=A0A166DAK0_9AGAM|nr:hypothetical protein FIBSPDRAFT_104896 [Fibularhizoctonia sp. CBS 109695]